MTAASAGPGAPEPPAAEPAGGLEVVEYTDPLCPWAWGSEPKLRRLRALLAGRAVWRPAYGMLFDEEEDDPAPDPAAETAWYARYVAEISAHTGAPHAVRLARVAACSRPASLAAVAARRQGPAVAAAVLRRLRESVFVLGEPADSTDRVRTAVAGLPGLDEESLLADMTDRRTLERLAADRAEARAPVPEVLGLRGPPPHPGAAKEAGDGYRYALPTLLLVGPAGRRVVPGWRPLGEYLEAVRAVAPQLRLRPEGGLLDPDAALERHLSLTRADLDLLTADRRPPTRAVRLESGNGPLWLHPAYAERHPAFATDRSRGR
ncbi:DsbA family protein [Kitasatospora sp. NBC_00240]|uniref:DsbA family oxidoreductase n=1 Tax=Kitasatospora sp. NBC_00240 TaxID=2903567 RepID=UPI002254585C|nr:DsbA family protein [Kitasatospora sp. NBC_00240]MCX5207852.1 DsbA family protein [Kitasatospora sp. NBC_00240]